jgi:nucleoside-diphosphate-sugar epimerase
LRNYARLYDVPVTIARPFNVYGPGQSLADGRIVPDLIRAALARDRVVLFSDGRATRAFCYVTDAVHAMWHVLLSAGRGEIFNVGNDEREISIAELAQEMFAVAGPPWLEIENRTGHFIDEGGQSFGGPDVPPELSSQELLYYDDVFPYILRHGCTIFICPTFMVRRRVFAEVGPFNLTDLILLPIWRCGCA